MMKLSRLITLGAMSCLALGACHTSKKLSYIKSFRNEIKFNMDSIKVTLKNDTVRVIYPELAMFDFNKDDVKQEAVQPLETFSRLLRQYDKIDFIIDGYTDNVGTKDFNLGLSKRRAENVEHFFEAHEVSRSRMRTHGMGESNPIMDNSTAEGRQANRRVEFVLYKRKGS